MPRYFFDTDDGDFQHLDQTGQNLADPGTARREALVTLSEMAHAKMPDDDRLCFTVRIRDAAETVLYSACLALTGEWHVAPPA